MSIKAQHSLSITRVNIIVVSKDVIRLIDQFKPKKYLLDLEVNKNKMTFKGTVIITGDRKSKPSQRFTLHQKDLKVTSAHITKHSKNGDEEVPVDRINSHNKFDELRLHSKKVLYSGSYTVRIDFEGIITRQMNGVYPCYFNHDNKDEVIIATQFESHHAREVFPCIDEPEAKAIFQLTLHHDKNDVALSNTPVKSQLVDPKSDLAVTIFEPTPHMSTYLLAFVFGKFEFITAKTNSNVEVRAYATPDNIEYTKFALSIAVKCLEFYNEYFGIDYPLAKVDLIALPDFASGAMENWGCITFREQAMLVDPKNTSLSSKQYVALVVAHELAHQWFGNLVTMRWWTDLWLNEGFASWIEYLAMDNIYPEWNLWTQFIIDEQQQALKLDALEHTHPVEVRVKHPDEIRTIFDAISYSKGASVIHMLHEYLGKEYFREGLSHYLNKHKYSNTDTIDLWDSLEEISSKPVKNFMSKWTGNAGFPLLSVVVADNEVTLSQKRFYTNPNHKNHTKDIWPVPILGADKLPDILKTESITVPNSSSETIKINSKQSGFYRTLYNASQYQYFGVQIRKGHLTPLDRLGLLSDLFEAAKAGNIATIDALQFLSNYENESEYVVWDTIASSIGNLRLVMDDENLRETMKPYIRNLVKIQLKRLGWKTKESDSHFDKLLRPIILGLAASADEPQIVKNCLQLFSSTEEVDDVSPELRVGSVGSKVKRGIDIDPDLRGTVFGTVARLGDEKDFNKLLRLHNNSSLSEERNTIAAALTGFSQPELINRSLELITTDIVRLQDVAYWIAYSFLNRHAKKATWKWLQENWKWLSENMGTDLSFYRMPIYAARVFSDSSFEKEFIAFFKPKLTPGFERSYNQSLEMLDWQSTWKKRSIKEIRVYFDNQ